MEMGKSSHTAQKPINIVSKLRHCTKANQDCVMGFCFFTIPYRHTNIRTLYPHSHTYAHDTRAHTYAHYTRTHTEEREREREVLLTITK